MYSFWRAGLITGFRSRNIQGIAAISVLLIFFAFLSASFSLRQPTIVALDVGLSLVRIVSLFFILFWTQDIFMKEIERKVVFSLLSQPVPRYHFLLGKYLSIITLLAISLVFMGLSLLLVVFSSGYGYDAVWPPKIGLNYILVFFGIWVDGCVICGFYFFICSFSETPFVAFISSIIFSISARSIGPVLAYVNSGMDGNEKLSEYFVLALRVVKFFVPDLSYLDFRNSVLYSEGVFLNYGLISQSILFLMISLIFSSIFFDRRSFE